MHFLRCIDQWTSYWLSRKVAPENQLRLTLRRIYILPSRLGFAVILMGFILFLFGTNYQNNLVLLLSFFVFSLFVTVLLLSCLNLSGITLTPQASKPAAINQQLTFKLKLESIRHKTKEGLKFEWAENHSSAHISKNSLTILEQQNSLDFYFTSTKRGIFHPSWLKITSYAPLGFFRTWAIMRVNSESFIYPEPIEGALPINQVFDTDGQNANDPEQDWQALNEYRPGDNLSRIYWRRYAMNQELWTRGELQNHIEALLELPEGTIILDINAPSLHGLAKEKRLSILCYWVLLLDQHHQPFALQLNGQFLKQGSGNEHRLNALKQLALA